MTIGARIKCMDCKHYDPTAMEFSCKAFPNGIPESILMGKVGHTKPLPGQTNTMVFEHYKIQ